MFSATSSANSTICQTPGNAQIVDAPPPVQYAQQFPFFGDACSSSTMAEITRKRWGDILPGANTHRDLLLSPVPRTGQLPFVVILPWPGSRSKLRPFPV